MIFSHSFPLHLSRQTVPLFVIVVYLLTTCWRFVVTQFGLFKFISVWSFWNSLPGRGWEGAAARAAHSWPEVLLM